MGEHKTEIAWSGRKPDDAESWEKIITERLSDVIGVCEVSLAFEEIMPNTGGAMKAAWRLTGAQCGGYSVGEGFPPPPSDLNVVPQLVRALSKAGKPVLADYIDHSPCPKCGGKVRGTADTFGAPMMTCMNHGCDYAARLFPIPFP